MKKRRALCGWLQQCDYGEILLYLYISNHKLLITALMCLSYNNISLYCHQKGMTYVSVSVSLA